MRLGFCGLGEMGRPMAARLIEAGHEVTVWNRTPEKAEVLRERGARVAGTPAEAAGRSEGVITMLADGDALEEVVFGGGGLAEGMSEGSALIEMSTVGPDAVLSVAGRLPERVDLLDAPVKGGPARAAAGELRILVGGSEDVFHRWEPVLGVLGKPRRIGPVGTGAAAKVLNNFAAISLVSVLGESMVLADALRLEEDLALDVLSGTPLAATLERQWKRATGKGPPSFRLRLAAKDLELGVAAAERGGARLRAVPGALAWLKEAEEAGLGEHDQAAVATFIRERSGLGRPPGARERPGRMRSSP